MAPSQSFALATMVRDVYEMELLLHILQPMLRSKVNVSNHRRLLHDLNLCRTRGRPELDGLSPIQPRVNFQVL